MERTLVILKPSALQRGLCGEIISRFEKKGLKITAMKMYRFTPEMCARHYSHLTGKSFYPTIEASMTASPVILMCLEGVDCVEVVRSMTGCTNGRKAPAGTIRGDYSMSLLENIVHASDSVENARTELDRFFSAEDYFEYDSPAFNYIYSKLP